MFRKIVLSTLAAVALLEVAVVPTQAEPFHHRPYNHHRHVYRPYAYRAFPTWAAANAWMGYQRHHGFECYYEWHGPQCFVYYR
jgi:hypothetical protein